MEDRLPVDYVQRRSSHKTDSGDGEHHSGLPQKVFGFSPESVFTFIPESRPASSRNRVHLQPGTAFTFPRITQTTYNYDPLGRTTSVVMPNSSGTVSYLYEGSSVRTTSPTGKWKKHESEPFGNLIKVTEPAPVSGADHVTNYAYTTLNQLKTSSMTRGTATQTRTFN